MRWYWFEIRGQGENMQIRIWACSRLAAIRKASEFAFEHHLLLVYA